MKKQKQKQHVSKFEVSWYQFIPGASQSVSNRKEFPSINSAKKYYNIIKRCGHVSYLSIDELGVV